MCSNIREDVFDDLLSVAFNKYLEEELSKMPSDEELAKMYPIPMKQMQKVQRYARRLNYRNSTTMVYLKRVAVACLIIISLTIAVLAVSPTVRDAIKESFSKKRKMATTVIDEGNEVKVVFDDPYQTVPVSFDIYQLNIGYVPEEFKLSDSLEESNMREYIYINAEDEYLRIGISISGVTSYFLNTEMADYQEFKINGDDGCMSYSSEFGTGCLVFGNDMYSVGIAGFVEKSELFMIARNIK